MRFSALFQPPASQPPAAQCPARRTPSRAEPAPRSAAPLQDPCENADPDGDLDLAARVRLAGEWQALEG